MSMKPKYILLAIIILSIGLRLFALESEGLWLDEAIAGYHGGQSLLHILNFVDANPPLHLLVLHPFTYLGIGEFALRLPSVIFGVLSVFLIYLLGKKMFNPRAGLIASLLLAVSSFHIFYSQEARPYSLFFFLSMLSFYFYMKFSKRPSRKNTITYLVSTILAIYTHYFAIFVPVVQAIHSFSRKNKKRWFQTQLILVISFIPAVFLIIRFFEEIGTFWLSQDFLNDLISIPFVFTGSMELAFLYGALTVAGLAVIWKKKNNRNLLLLWLLLPLLIPLVISFYKVIFLPKYVIFSLVPILLLASATLDKIKTRSSVPILALLLILSFFPLSSHYFAQDYEDWRAVSAYADSLPKQYTNVLLEPGYTIHPYVYYSLPHCFKSRDIYTCSSISNVFTAWGNASKEVLYTENTPYIIYIVRHVNEEIESPIFSYLKENYQLSSVKDFPTPERGEISVYHFTREL